MLKEFEILKSNLERALSQYDDVVTDEVVSNYPKIKMLQEEQLLAGRDSKGKLLTPTYLTDPYFKTQRQAIGYMNWKDSLGWGQTLNLFPTKPKQVPNLIINGYYTYDRIEVSYNNLNLEIDINSPIRTDLYTKYGADLTGLDEISINWIKENYLTFAINTKIKNIIFNGLL